MLDDVLEVAGGGWGIAAAVLVGGGLLLARGGRPLAKRAIRGYLTATDTVQSWAAGLVEQAQDLYEESKAELAATTNETGGARRADRAPAEA